MRRLRLPLLLLLALLLGWGAVEGGVALGDRLSHGLGTATDLRPGSGSDAPATPVVEPATEWTAASAAALADLRAERRRQRQAARLRHAVPESASGPVSPAEAGAGATSAAQDPRSASAAAFRRAMRRFGAGLGLTPPDPLASLAGDPGAHDSSIVPGDPWSRRDPSLEGPDAPGRGTPAKPAEPERIDVVWDGNGRYRSVITIEPGEGLRRPARVETFLTRDPSRPIVTYEATAFRDAAGELQVDARGAQVRGPWSGHWSPDSFGIDDYGQVRSLDDQPIGGNGSVGARERR